MTMHNTAHPDDERLAALAGADPDARSDRGLTAHVAACERCGPLVADIASLHSALASLPDITPSRPLRLLPPAAAPAPASRGTGWLRWITTPAMAAGAVLVLVGAMGSSGALTAIAPELGQMLVSDRAGGPPNPSTQEAAPGMQSGEDSSYGAIQASSAPSGDPAASRGDQDDQTGSPWLPLIAVGVALVGSAALMRYALVPRAG